MHIQAYLFLSGRCEEAIDFYRRTLGADVVELMRVKDSPEPLPPDMAPPGWEDRILHATVRIGDTEVMMSDGLPNDTQGFNGFSLSLAVDDDAEAERLFAALGEGGHVHMPMAPTFFASRFGAVNDRFGVPWMILGPLTES